MTTFGSVCSGIEAASVAWHPLGWRAAWLAEIEPFPSAVLAHHYPGVPNLGDMTKLAAMIRAGQIEAPDVFCGGTPCQAFSVAGLRRSLDDARGNLSLTFCEIANELDAARSAAGKPAATVFWENVPGVLNTKDNAFGCFLAGLAGEADALEPPGGRWSNAGAVFGPSRAVAWRVLDAQYFGVAQRRRRVFVVASAREGFDPAAVLFEWDGVRRDTAPRREAGEGAAATLDARAQGGGFPGTDGACGGHVQPVVGPLTAACGPNGHGGSGLATDKGAEAGHILAFGGNRTSGPIDVTPALLAQPGSGWKGDFESEAFLVQPAHTLRGEGFGASEDGTGRGMPLVPVAFDTTQITSAANYSNPKPGDPCHPLAAGAHPPAIAFSSKDHGADASQDLAPTLRAMGHAGSHANGGGQLAVAHAFDARQSDVIQYGDKTGPLDTDGHSIGVQHAMQVRRLTPRECERLQGFPDDYTAIPWRGKPASECTDGPRYKALGNSWAVPNVRWIGQRIDAELRRLAAANDNQPAARAATAA